MIKPMEDRILVELDEGEEKTLGGILLPDQAKEKAQQGKVLAVGPGRYTTEGILIECEVLVGETILIKKYEGTTVNLEGKEYTLIAERNVLAKVE